MSSSNGDPSGKMSWYKSMCASIKNGTKSIGQDKKPKDKAADDRQRKVEDAIYGGT